MQRILMSIAVPSIEVRIDQILVPSDQNGRPDPRNGFNLDDIEYRVTVVNGLALACTCYGFHFHGHCKHLQTAAREAAISAGIRDFAYLDRGYGRGLLVRKSSW